MFDIKFLLLFLIIVLAKTVEAVTGFGSTVIALTLGAQIYPIEWLLPILVPLNIILSIYIVARHGRTVNVRELTHRILPLTIGGLVVGMVIFDLVQGRVLKLGFGIFVVLFSIFELYRILRAVSASSEKPLTFLKSAAWLFTGGVIHGIYASGGPLVVYYANKKLKDKSEFRSTLSVLWLVLNILLLANYIQADKISLDALKACGALLPAIGCGILIGEALHRRIPERTFRIMVFILLIAAGVSLALKA